MPKIITKECKNHGITEFVFHPSRGYHRCRKCSNKYVSERRVRIKKFFVEKLGGKCKFCSYNKYIGALEFHHLDPSKKDFTLGGKTISIKRIEKEIRKCILICANCHAEEHNRLGL